MLKIAVVDDVNKLSNIIAKTCLNVEIEKAKSYGNTR